VTTIPIVLLAPGPNLSFGGAPSGAAYVSDRNSLIVIANGSVADEAALIAVGCTLLYPGSQTMALPVFTVATLPSASPSGQASFVSNATQTISAGLGAIAAGGGANFVPVYSDGTNWRIG
jgi:hypothetical protein